MSLFCCLNKGNCCEVEEMDPGTGYGVPLPVILSIRSNRQSSLTSNQQQQQQQYNNDNLQLDTSPPRSPPLFQTPTPIQTPAPGFDNDGHRVSRRVVESDHGQQQQFHHHHQRMGPGCGLEPIHQQQHTGSGKKVQYTGSSSGGGLARNPGHLLERDDKAMTGYNVDHPPESYPGYSGGGWPIGYTSAVSSKS